MDTATTWTSSRSDSKVFMSCHLTIFTPFSIDTFTVCTSNRLGCSGIISTLKQYSAIINSAYSWKSNQTKAAKLTNSIYGCAVEGGDYLVSLCKNDKLQYLQQRRATPGRPRCWWSPLSPSCQTLVAALAASDLIRWQLLIKYWTPHTVNKLFGKQLLDAIEQIVQQNVWACSQFAIKAV